MRLVVDTSAIMAIRLGEANGHRLEELLIEADPVMSAGTATELSLVWQARFGRGALRGLDHAISSYRIALEPVLVDDLTIIRGAIEAYGKGRRAAPACLNFGDLFAYALAKRLGLPLLFSGDDFRKTDLRPALPPHGSA